MAKIYVRKQSHNLYIYTAGLDINHWPAGPAGVFHSGGQSGQWTKESAGPKGPAIISSDHKVFVLHWPEV